METIKWEDVTASYELQARNVNNEKAQIQMIMNVIPKGKGNCKMFCIDIPKNKVKEFMEAIK